MERSGHASQRPASPQLVTARSASGSEGTPGSVAIVRASTSGHGNDAHYLRSLVGWVLLDDAWLEPLLAAPPPKVARHWDEPEDPDYHDGWSEIRPRFARLIMPPRQ